MLTFEPGLYVRIDQIDNDRAPQPLPLASGFTEGAAYRVVGMHRPSETGEAYLMLVNDRDEIWFVSNKHAKAHAFLPETRQFSIPLGELHPLVALRPPPRNRA
jgi:hypothetical protein